MRVLFVLAGLGAGGAERVVSLIASDWVEKGDECTIVAFDHPVDPIYHDFDPRISFLRLDLPASSSGFLRKTGRSLRRLLALRSAIKQHRPELVISFLTKVNVLTLLATRGLGVKTIVSERNNPERQASNPAWNAAIAALYKQADAIVMQSHASLRCLPPAVLGKAMVIPNPIAGPQFQAQSTGSHVITAVGRLCAQKGFDLLLPAFCTAAAGYPDWRLVIWGEGPERTQLARQAEDLGIQDRIELPGLSRTPGAWIGCTAFFVLSSRFEGFPNALGEAMRAGLPVIAFDCDFGPAEMISHDSDGLLVPPENVPSLSAALERMMKDSALRARLGAAARRSSQRFNSSDVIRKWSELANRLAR